MAMPPINKRACHWPRARTSCACVAARRSASCCSVSPSLMGLAASTAPPPNTRMNARPAAP